MPTDAEREALYADLRAATLARHYALGRYFRANFFSTGNFLGIQKARSVDCRTPWQKVPKRHSGQPPEGYDGADDLLHVEEPRQTLERWRVVRRNRENPVMMTGMRLAQLAIEHKLGSPDALPIIRLTLGTLGSLYKVKDPNDPFAGYVIRYDECTTDRWTSGFERGREVPVRCCTFFLDADPGKHVDPGGKAVPAYMHCTPLDHPTYAEARRKNDGFVAHALFRHHEPSMDELVGLVAGYDMVHKLVDDAGVREIVKTQVTQLARYLAAFSYLMVRPCGGFAARGSAGFLQALEYPFNRVFRRITGREFWAPWSTPSSPWASDQGFVDACKAARVWLDLEEAVEAGGLAGAAAGTVLSPPIMLNALLGATFAAWLVDEQGLGAGQLLADEARSLLTLIRDELAAFNVPAGPAAGSGLGYALGRAIAIYEHRAAFDVWHEEMQGEFALAYLLRWLPPRRRFEWWMQLKPRDGNWSDGFKVFVGLMALDDLAQGDTPGDGNTVLKDQYLKWYQRYQVNNVAADEVQSPSTQPWAATAMTAAVASLLDGRRRDETNLTAQLDRMFAQLTQGARRQLVLTDDENGEHGEGCAPPTPSKFVAESQDKFYNGKVVWIGGYMTCLSIAWLHARRVAARGGTPAAGFPTPPAAGAFAQWPRATIPPRVIAAARAGQVLIPLDALQRAPLPPQSQIPAQGIDLLADAPDKPDSPRCGQPAPPLSSIEFIVDVRASPPRFPQPNPVRKQVDFHQSAPPISAALRPHHTLVCSEPILEPGTIRESVLLMERRYDDDGVTVRVVVEASHQLTGSWPPSVRRSGRFRGRFFLSWMPNQVEVCDRPPPG
jgi:hypothetical protein